MSRGTQERKQERCLIFGHGTITHSGVAFQQLNLTRHFLTFLTCKQVTFPPYNPQHQSHKTIARIVRLKLGLGFFVFARRY